MAPGYAPAVPVLRLFAQAREAAGTAVAEVPGATVAEVLDRAASEFGEQFTAVLRTCRVWVNGEPVPDGTDVGASPAVGPDDEVAVLPPVSGGC